MKRLLAILLLLLSAHPALAATLNSLQTGTVTVPAGSSAAVTPITAVNLSKAILFGSYSSSANNPDTGSTGFHLENGTTMRGTRVASTGTAAVTIRYQAAEFEGALVQRGQTLINATPKDVAISAVNTAKAFVLLNLRVNGGNYSDDDFVRGEITSSTNLRLTPVVAGGGVTVFWQVVEWTNSAVQKGNIAFGTGDSSLAATLTSVNTSKTLILWSYSTAAGTVSNIGQKGVGCVLTNATTVTCSRTNTGQTMTVSWFAVEFTDNTTVQRGDEAFTSSETQRNITITSVDTARSVVVGGGFQSSSGRSSYAADDVPGVQAAEMQLTSGTNLRLTRALTGSVSASIPWQVVTFEATPAAPATNNFIQSGRITIPANAPTATATLTRTVNMAKSIVIGSYSSSANDPDTGSAMLELTNGTTVTARRPLSAGALDVTVFYQVIELEGASVQTASILVDAPTKDVAISAVNAAKSFVIFTHRVNGGTYNDDDFVRAEITSSTNLRFTKGVASGVPAVFYQVVSLNQANVQSGTIAFGTADASLNATLTSVNTAKTLLLWSFSTADGTFADIGQKGMGCVLTNATTITCSRLNTGQTMTVAYSAVEFTDNTTVQRGDEAFTSAETVRNVTISSIDETRSLTVGGGFQNAMGRSTYSADDIPGVQMAEMQLTSATNLRMTRALTGSVAATIPWQVVTFSQTPAVPPPTVTLQFDPTLDPQGQVTLYWDANTEADLAGYRIYYSPIQGVFFRFVDIGLDTTGTPVRNVLLPVGNYTYYFRITAYDTFGGESNLSNEISDGFIVADFTTRSAIWRGLLKFFGRGRNRE